MSALSFYKHHEANFFASKVHHKSKNGAKCYKCEWSFTRICEQQLFAKRSRHWHVWSTACESWLAV